MRSLMHTASCALVALPFIASTPQASANTDLLNQAQKFFNGNSDNSRDAYERGRQDELRRQQADREERRWRREHRERGLTRYEQDRDYRYRDPTYGYNR